MRSIAKIPLLLLLCLPLFGFQGESRAQLYLKSAEKLQTMGRNDLALRFFDKAIAAEPKLAPAYRSRGFIYLQQGKSDLALDDFNRLIELAPEPANYLTRGLALSQRGDKERAASDFRKGCELGDAGACELLEQIKVEVEVK